MQDYDICMISFEELRIDARTLNIARTYARAGKKVIVVGFGSKFNVNNPKSEEKIDYKFIKIPDYSKVWQKWLYYYPDSLKALKNIRALNVFAEDIYSLPTAVKIAKRSNAKLIYDSREIYSEMGPLAGRKFKQNIITKIENHYLSYVTDIVVTGELDKDLLQKKWGNNFKFHLIMNLPPLKDKIESNKIREEYNISKDKTILLYQGMILQGRGIETIIKILPLNTSLIFVVLGSGSFINEARKMAEELGVVDRVIFAGSKNYDELHEWTCSSDIGLSLIEPITLSYSLALPNKMFEYMMAGIPFVCTDLPAMKKIVDNYKAGVCVSTDPSNEDILNAITIIQQNQSDFQEKCLDASKLLCFENQSETLIEILN